MILLNYICWEFDYVSIDEDDAYMHIFQFKVGLN